MLSLGYLLWTLSHPYIKLPKISKVNILSKISFKDIIDIIDTISNFGMNVQFCMYLLDKSTGWLAMQFFVHMFYGILCKTEDPKPMCCYKRKNKKRSYILSFNLSCRSTFFFFNLYLFKSGK